MSWSVLSVHLPALMLALPILGAFTAPVAGLLGDKVRNFWSVFISAVILIASVALLKVAAAGTAVYVMGGESWNLTLPGGLAYPIRIILEVDSFNALLSVIGCFASFAGMIYGVSFIKAFSGKSLYTTLYFLLSAGMLGMMLTGDIFNFFVFLEIASIGSFGLIAYWRDRPEAIEASFKYMLISQIAAMTTLMALGFLYGRYNLLNMAALGKVIQAGIPEKIALALLVTSLAMKCGAFPMHMWMPDSYAEAPASVTALLVVVSQASLVALCRILFSVFGVMASDTVIPWTMIVLGMMSMFFGVSMAVVQHEVKRLMSYHSVSQVGYMLMAFGVGLLALKDPKAIAEYGAASIKGGVFHMVNYLMYKGLLFLCAGSLYYVTGTKDLDKMGGLSRKMPLTTAMFFIAAAAISGIPPFNGFVSKLMIYQSSFAIHPILPTVAIVTSILTLASFVKVFQSAFLGPEKPEFAEAREVPFSMIAGMAVLTVVILGLSLFPTWVVAHLVEPAASALIDKGAYVGAVMGGGI